MGILDVPIRTRPRVAVLVFGQSNEQGPVPITDRAAYPQAFTSTRNPGVLVPLSPIPVRDRGGWWPKVYDDLYDWGYDLQIVNAAVGGMGMLSHVTGYANSRVNSQAYYQKRTGTNHPDRGDYGDVYSTGGKWFNVIGGRNRQAFNAPPHAGVVGTSTYQDFIGFGPTSEISAASPPDVSAVAVGDTIADGTLSIKCILDRYSTSGSSFDPTSVQNIGGVLGEGAAGYGFDPLGILTRAWEMLAATHAQRKIVYFSQGQSDLGISSTTYKNAVIQTAAFFLRRNVDVVLGNTVYSPASSGSTAGNYQNQVDGCSLAKAALDPYYPGKVYLGANLYGSMGTTGPMGGQSTTASVSGTTMTVTALKANSGTGIAVGQNVWNGQTLLGTVLSQLTGTAGSTGTYQLSASATVASTTLVCAGAWIQYDGVHISGAGAVGPAVGGVSSAGKYVADSLKAFLPQR